MSATGRDAAAIEALRESGFSEQADTLERATSAKPDPTVAGVLRPDPPEPEPEPNGEPKLLTRAELESLTHERHVELEEKQPGLIQRSLAAL
jgi:hypothetical protein